MWGGLEGNLNNAWGWEKICKQMELRGLGIKVWGPFNKTLLGKWRWSNHLLFSCGSSWLIWWSACYSWLGLETALPNEAKPHLLQHVSLSKSKEQKKALGIVWLAIVWSIWQMRNKLIFRGMNAGIKEGIDVIKIRTWRWLQVKCKEFRYFVFEWVSNPISCIETL